MDFVAWGTSSQTPAILRQYQLAGQTMRTLLSREISTYAAHLELLLALGKVVRVIPFVLEEDSEIFILELLQLPGEGILIDHNIIHNKV